MKKFKIFLLITILLFFIGCASTPYIPIVEGDCVDRAVKIRQSLKKQGYKAELVLGLIGDKKGHCWVRYKDEKTGKWKIVKNY